MKCPQCALLSNHCICSEIPRLYTEPKMTVIRHYKESYRSSNSARPAELLLENLHIYDFGLKNNPLPDIDIQNAVLLFPIEDDAPIYTSAERPQHIIILDGTWKQAHKMKRRIKGLSSLPRLSPVSKLNLPRIREPHFAGGMCTFEACIEALSLYNSIEKIESIVDVYRLWLDRMRLTTGIREPLVDGISFKEARKQQDCIDQQRRKERCSFSSSNRSSKS